jgi:hypothetical protein
MRGIKEQKNTCCTENKKISNINSLPLITLTVNGLIILQKWQRMVE